MSDNAENLSHVDIYYEKNPTYKTIFVDGLIGGKTATGSINMNFYSTRNAIPKSVRHNVEANGMLSQNGVPSADSKIGIIREIETGIYMDEKTATDIFDFLKILLNK